METNSGEHAKKPANVQPLERFVSAVAGAYLLYNCIKKPHKASVLKAAAGGFLLYRGVTGYCQGYALMGKPNLPDIVRNINIRTTLTVNRPRHEVYAFWRKLDNLPLFMSHLENVNVLDEMRSEWEVRIPGYPGKIRWDATIVKDEPGELLGWSSLPHSDIENAGKVTFSDAGPGATEIEVVISYRPPLGGIGAGISKLFNPLFAALVRSDVRGFKKYMETRIPATQGYAGLY
ncbi:MAG: SRPBCC family protein [Chitinophagaceae bacterium]